MTNPDTERSFRVTSVQKCAPPDGQRTGRWHRYTVENALTVIEGYARGSKNEVIAHATRYVEQLNEKNNPNYKQTVRRAAKRIARPPAQTA